MRSRWVAPEQLVDAGGLYALYFDGTLGYIGVSSRVRTRIASHKKMIAGRPYTVKVSYDTALDSRTTREGRLLRRLRPSGNRFLSERRASPGTNTSDILTLRVPPDVKELLKDRAAEAGVTTSIYAGPHPHPRRPAPNKQKGGLGLASGTAKPTFRFIERPTVQQPYTTADNGAIHQIVETPEQDLMRRMHASERRLTALAVKGDWHQYDLELRTNLWLRQQHCAAIQGRA